MERGVQWRMGGALALLVITLLTAAAARGATGDLSAPGCLSGDAATSQGCATVPDAGADGASSGLDILYSVAVSPDPVGTDVYAVSQQDDAIVHFDRDPATNAVTFGGCVTGETETGPSGSGACAALATAAPFPTSNSGLDSPVDAVVSPDGEDVYVVAENDDSIVHFDRNTSTGAIAFVDCLTAETETGTGAGGPCATIAGAASNGTNTGLNFPTGIAISPGGTSIYVTASFDDSIARFTRTPATGVLAYNGCISGDSDVTACAAAPTTTVSGDDSGLAQPFSPEVSADGDNVYVGSHEDAAITWFDRALNGSLSWNDCITGDTGAGLAPGTGACPTAVPSATGTQDGQNSGLARAQTVALPPGGDQVFVGSQLDSSIYYFGRNAGTGDLSISGCVSGTQQISPGNCERIPSNTTFGEDSGLKAVQALAFSPDGKSLYAAAAGDDAIATFDRTISNGEIAWDSCVSGETESGPAGTTACAAPDAGPGGDGSGLNGLRALAVTPDGLQLVGASAGDVSNDGGDALVFATRSNAPQTAIDSGPPLTTNDPTPSFGFSADEAGATFQCRVDSGAFGPCSGPGTSHTTSALADGPHSFQVRARNDASPPGMDPTPAVRAVVVDTTAPDVTISAGPSGLTSSRDARFDFSGSGDPSTFECRLDGAAFAPCTSPASYTGLSEGQHTFEARAEDAAGNVDGSPAGRSFSVDTVQPDTSITTSPKKTVRTDKEKKKATFRFITTEPGTFECKRDKGKDFKPCTAPYKKKYKRGKHTFTVRATDEAGNVGTSDSHTWKVKRKK